MIGRTPNSSYFSVCDWKGCAVTRYGPTADECVGERHRGSVREREKENGGTFFSPKVS